MENTTATEGKKTKFQIILHGLWDSSFSISVISLILSLLILAALAVIYGANPLVVIGKLFEGALSGKSAIVYTLSQMAPLILAALAVYIPYKAGFFNIGGQGQIQVSALAAVLVTLYLEGSPFLIIPLALTAGIIVGMLAVLPPLLLKLKRGANEVTTTMMMTFVCTNLVYALVTTVFKDPKAFYGTTRSVPVIYHLPILPESFGMHIGIYLAVILSLLTAWVLKNTVAGKHLEAAGHNPDAAKVFGIKVNKIISFSVLAGAGCAGLAGGIQALGLTHRVAENWALPWGFAGLSVAFLGGNPIGIIPVAFILAIIETGARFMQAMTGVPSAILSIMQGVPVILFVGLSAWKRMREMKTATVSGVEE